MRLTALIGAFGLTAMFGAGAEAQSLACGGEYTIKRGDTLQKVTRMAYGEGLSWSFLYNANKRVVGPNPSLIEVGMVLKVPCRKGQTPGATAQSTAPAASAASTSTATSTSTSASAQATESSSSSTQSSVQVAARPPSAKIRFVTASDFAPFTDENLPQGGMITEILDVAMKQVRSEDQYKIDFVNDWGAQFSPLISDRHYEFTFPWYRPNCDVIEKLGENSQFRCRNLAWSDPIFEQIISYYIRADETEPPTVHSDLFGKTFCRPVGWATFMMEELDLSPPRIKMINPVNAADCFEALLDGSADVVVMASITADDTIRKMGAVEQLTEVPTLASIVKLHAVTSIDNPQKEELLEVLNSGIKDVRESGKWFEIVQRHLAAHAQRLASN